MSPEPAQVRLVENATDAEIAKATQTLCDAFGGRFFTDELDGDIKLVPYILGAYLKAGLVGGQVYFAEDATEGIVGVAIWFQPGHTSFGTPEQRAAGWDELMGKLSERCRSWWTEFLKLLYDEFVEKQLGSGVMRAAYHLQLIGIHPKYQKRGIGSKLLGIVGEQARVNNTTCVLETPSKQLATEVYGSVGYRIRGHLEDIKDADGKPSFGFYVLQKDERAE
ncbi:hypothetical protein B0H15DRAFT_824697 [Mycena belliarum]|uniref:N-acetyltransferase domain-containing protein n=1 Tax=Mycena belliarum TaxID=1033014 RepID=A0AAD6XQY0_9AGAR|nr:hypothetical protein B0H15DRAFT_824697 [Mycena belliae]